MRAFYKRTEANRERAAENEDHGIEDGCKPGMAEINIVAARCACPMQTTTITILNDPICLNCGLKKRRKP
jgi:hypothetical protein